MRATAIKLRAKNLVLKPHGPHDLIRRLLLEGFFDRPVTTPKIIAKIKSKFGKRLRSNYIHTYMQKFMLTGIIQAFPRPDGKGNLWVLASVSEEQAFLMIERSKKEQEVVNELFSHQLVHKLQPKFKVELRDLEYNFGKSGTCTAFLLRKILEKLIFLAFAKHNLGHKLKKTAGKFMGLESMLTVAAEEKIEGLSFLTPKTAKNLRGIKFLGDTSAHNPLINVDMKTIIPQMPFIITAYEELAEKL